VDLLKIYEAKEHTHHAEVIEGASEPVKPPGDIAVKKRSLLSPDTAKTQLGAS
jgi:hypothetical protein